MRVHFERGRAVLGLIGFTRAEGIQQRAQDAPHVWIVVADEEAQLVEVDAEHGRWEAGKGIPRVNHNGPWVNEMLPSERRQYPNCSRRMRSSRL